MPAATRLAAIVLTAGLASCGPAERPAPAETRPTGHVPWGYGLEDGPARWGRLSVDYDACESGTRQSPVDLRDAEAREAPRPTFDYGPSAIELVNTGHTVELRYDPGSWLGLAGARYALDQIHFHAPSEHTIGGRSFPVEIHLVHRGTAGAAVVVGLLAEAGAPQPALDPILDNLPTGTELPRAVLGRRFAAADLLPTAAAWYRYDGSRTTPPCTEGVRWLVLATPVSLDATQLEQLRAVVSRNNRPVQPINGRPVFIETSS